MSQLAPSDRKVCRDDIPVLDGREVTRAIAVKLGEDEVIALQDGRLFRICEEEEASCYYPRRSANLPPRPMRPVQLVDVEVLPT